MLEEQIKIYVLIQNIHLLKYISDNTNGVVDPVDTN